MPSMLQSATANPDVVIRWSDDTLFTGFLLLGIVFPTLSDVPFAAVNTNSPAPGELIPTFLQIPVVEGEIDNTVGILYNSSLTPPQSKYVAWYYDNSKPPRQLAGPSDPFIVDTPIFTPPELEITSPTPGTTPPVPN